MFVVYPGVSNLITPDLPDMKLIQSAGTIRKKIVLFVGSLSVRKNLAFLLSFFPDVLRLVPDAYLVIVGDGEERARLEHQAKDLGIASNVHFSGFLSEDVKIRWLNTCDVFVSPSKLEGFGMNVAEAMACCKPVVVSNVGSLPEIVEDNVTGYVIPLDDRRGFVRAIVQLLDDPPLCRKMGQAGERRVRERFRWEQAAAEIKGIYEEVIARRRRG